jgi:hypothetical protein
MKWSPRDLFLLSGNLLYCQSGLPSIILSHSALPTVAPSSRSYRQVAPGRRFSEAGFRSDLPSVCGAWQGLYR